MRLFFAVQVPEEVKTCLLQAQNELRKAIPEGYLRYTRPDLLHATLAFLGEVHQEHLQDLTEVANALCAQTPAIKITFEGIGCFPAWRSPQVLWLGVEEEAADDNKSTGVLTKLGNELSARCSTLGNAKLETTTVLHVTLARSNTKLTRERAKVVSEVAHSLTWTSFGEAEVTEILLFESTLGKGPHEHKIIHRFALQPARSLKTTRYRG